MSKISGFAFGLCIWTVFAHTTVGTAHASASCTDSSVECRLPDGSLPVADAEGISPEVVAKLNHDLAQLQKVDAVDPSGVTADKIGGTDVLCIPMAKRQALFDMAKDHGAEVAHFTLDETEAFLRTTNALPPITTLTGANMVTMADGDDAVVVAFDEGDRFCRIMQDLSKKTFDEVMKKAASL
jgi:hypothetical protein